ncbi:MAG: KOW domain-containing RNA-binding protein [Ruminococcus sp.]|nr:KOW domain-containing RNA-binding protein [Ruminococcus sp.]
MKRQLGSVVKAQAGRDSGGFFAVVGFEEDHCFIADGKSRKLGKPKRKNIKHLSFTNSVIDLNEITDKKLRTALKQFSGDE